MQEKQQLDLLQSLFRVNNFGLLFLAGSSSIAIEKCNIYILWLLVIIQRMPKIEIKLISLYGNDNKWLN